jgi:hypothetical protein
VDPSQLDAVSAILGALAASGAAGVREGVKDVAKGTVTGARDRLLKLLRQRFRNDPLADAKVSIYTAEPTPANAEALRGHLIAAGIDGDHEIVSVARELLQHAGPTAIGPGSVAGTIISSSNTGPGHSHIGGVQHYGAIQQPDPH